MKTPRDARPSTGPITLIGGDVEKNTPTITYGRGPQGNYVRVAEDYYDQDDVPNILRLPHEERTRICEHLPRRVNGRPAVRDHSPHVNAPLNLDEIEARASAATEVDDTIFAWVDDQSGGAVSAAHDIILDMIEDVPALCAEVRRLREEIARYEVVRQEDTASLAKPIDMVLFCPACGTQHVDAPQPLKEWSNPPHRSHLCHECGHIWRPADVPTNGVDDIRTVGKSDHDVIKPPRTVELEASTRRMLVEHIKIEREACAKICDDASAANANRPVGDPPMSASTIAERIRARESKLLAPPSTSSPARPRAGERATA